MLFSAETMYQSHQQLPNLWSHTVKLCLIILLWAGYANVSHSMDIDPHHHEEHQCELYASLQHALGNTVYELPTLEFTDEIIPALPVQSVILSHEKFCARDPPRAIVHLFTS
jgi:hypothetical protein